MLYVIIGLFLACSNGPFQLILSRKHFIVMLLVTHGISGKDGELRPGLVAMHMASGDT